MKYFTLDNWNDATDIREVHDIDTNETWGCFRTGNPSLALAASRRLNAQPFSGSLSERPAAMFRDFSWWPDSMTRSGQRLLEWREATGFRVRLAADEDAGLVCFHRDGH